MSKRKGTKIHGNYCGPGYCGGKYLLPGEQCDFSVPPVDEADAVCREHDKGYDTMDPLIRMKADALAVARLEQIGKTARTFKQRMTAKLIAAGLTGAAIWNGYRWLVPRTDFSSYQDYLKRSLGYQEANRSAPSTALVPSYDYKEGHMDPRTTFWKWQRISSTEDPLGGFDAFFLEQVRMRDNLEDGVYRDTAMYRDGRGIVFTYDGKYWFSGFAKQWLPTSEYEKYADMETKNKQVYDQQYASEIAEYKQTQKIIEEDTLLRRANPRLRALLSQGTVSGSGTSEIWLYMSPVIGALQNNKTGSVCLLKRLDFRVMLQKQGNGAEGNGTGRVFICSHSGLPPMLRTSAPTYDTLFDVATSGTYNPLSFMRPGLAVTYHVYHDEQFPL